MEEVGKLTVERRQGTGKGVARKLRTQGKIPGVCYGYSVGEPLPIAVDARALKASLDPTKRQNTVINMTIQENGQAGQSLLVMVKDYQVDRIRRELIHVDLVAIDTNKEVVVEVPIEYAGKPKGLILGGQLHVVRHMLEVRCKPADIPAKVVVDVSELDIGDVIHVSDLTMAPGIAAASPGRLTLATCAAPAKEAAPGQAAEGEAAPAEGAAQAPKEKEAEKK